jgi:hypothetical protein
VEVGLERGVEDIVDAVDGEKPPRLAPHKILIAEDVSKELKQTPNLVRVPLHARSARAQAARDAKEEVDVSGEQRVDLDELGLLDLLPLVGVERERGGDADERAR